MTRLKKGKDIALGQTARKKDRVLNQDYESLEHSDGWEKHGSDMELTPLYPCVWVCISPTTQGCGAGA